MNTIVKSIQKLSQSIGVCLTSPKLGFKLRYNSCPAAFKLALVVGLIILQNGVQAQPLVGWNKMLNPINRLCERQNALLEKLCLLPFQGVELGTLVGENCQKSVSRLPDATVTVAPESPEVTAKPSKDGHQSAIEVWLPILVLAVCFYIGVRLGETRN